MTIAVPVDDTDKIKTAGLLSSRAWLAIGIALTFLVTVLLPIGSVFYGGVQDRSPVYGDTQFSLDAMQRLFMSASFGTAVVNTITLSSVVTVASLFIGTVLAWIMARINLPFKSALNVLIIAPLFLSPLTGALAWIILAAPNIGLLNIFMYQTMAVRNAFNIFSFPGLVFVMVLHYVPYCYMAVYAMLSSMNASLEESARSLGAGIPGTALKITIPLAFPAIASSALLIFVLSMEMFTIPGLLGRPFDFETVVYSIYYAIRREPAEWNTAAAIGFLLLLAVATGLFAQNFVRRGARNYSVVSGQNYRTSEIQVGAWRWAVFAGVFSFVFMAVVLPMGALVFGSLLEFTTSNPARMIFTLDHYRSLFGGIALDAIWNTLTLSLAAPTAVVIFVFLVGYWCRNSQGVGEKIFVFFTRLPLALPGVVLGVGLLWLYYKIPLPIYGTLLILFLAYFTHILPYAANNIFPSLQQVDKSLDESARVLGARSMTIARRIHAPLTGRAIVAAWLIGFILCSRELNASIMLYTPQTRVMEVLIWDLTESGRSNFAYAISVVQALVIALLAFTVHSWVRLPGAARLGESK